MSILEKNNTKKRQIKKVTFQVKFEENNNNKKYEVNTICNSAVYAKQSKIGYLLGYYQSLSQKDYPEKNKTQESILIIKHLWTLFSTYPKKHLEKLLENLTLVNSVSLMTKPIVKLFLEFSVAKKKIGQPAKIRGNYKCYKKFIFHKFRKFFH